MQILAVAMVLGHTVLTPGLSMLGHELDTAMETGAHAVLSAARGVRLAESNRKGLNKLPAKSDNTKQLTGYNFAHIDNINEEKIYKKVNKLFKIKQDILKYTHEDEDMLLVKVNRKISHIVANLRKAMKYTRTYIRQNEKYRKLIVKELTKIRTTQSLSDVDIQSVRNAYNRAGIDFANTDKHLTLNQMIDKLIQVKKELEVKTIKRV